MPKSRSAKKPRPSLEPSSFSGAERLSSPLPQVSENQQGDSALSALFMEKGKLCILHGDDLGLHFFDMALQLTPDNADLYYQQGSALLAYGEKEKQEKTLKCACQRFKKTLSLNPNHFHAWHHWGHALYLLGVYKQEPAYFSHAKEKYEQALALPHTKLPSDCLATLYQRYGANWIRLAYQSKEPADFCAAINAFDKTTTYRQDHTAAFWLSYGHSAFQVAKQLFHPSFLIKAIRCYKKALAVSVSSAKGWHYLGEAIHALYLLTLDEDHFAHASECFELAAQLAPKSSNLWLRWARLYFDSGLILEDTRKLNICLKKCRRGLQSKSDHLPLVLLYSETLAHVGALTEDLPMICEAHNQSEQGKILGATPSESLYLEGMISMARGTYFQDADEYYQATEKFQELLSRDRTDAQGWLALGQGFFAAGQLDNDMLSIERACQFFKRAAALHPTPYYTYMRSRSLVHYGDLTQDTEPIESALAHLHQLFEQQQHANYPCPHWLTCYVHALSLMGELTDSENHYHQALDLAVQLLSLQPESFHLHHRLATLCSHYAHLTCNSELFRRSFYHYHIAYQRNRENDQVLLDWGLALANYGESCAESSDHMTYYLQKAEHKLLQAIRLGNIHAYYSLACLYSIMDLCDKACYFLEKARSFEGLPPVEEILEDEWLENVKATPFFRAFIERVKDAVNESP